MPTIAIIGSVVADILVQTARLPRSGENMHVPRVEVVTGGKAANAAVTFARLGGGAHLLGNIGEDGFGVQAVEALQMAGVNVDGLSQDPSTPTGAGVLLVEADGQTAFMIAPGANQTLTPDQLEANLRPLLPKIDGLLFNFESPEAALFRALELADKYNIPTFVDAGPYRPYSSDLWCHAAILTPNEPETEALVGHAIPDEAAAIAAARTLLAQGPRAVVLKLGPRGALLATAEGIEHLPAYDIQPVDSAGAGDAFTAGLVWSVLNGGSLNDAVRFANACGAVAAGRFGTMPAMPTLADVRELQITHRQNPI